MNCLYDMMQACLSDIELSWPTAPFRGLLHDESGQDLIEYALIAALVALGSVTAMRGLATVISTTFTNVATNLTSVI